MPDLSLAIVVLAAGEGTRMRSPTPKVLHQICGRTMLGHVLATADALGSNRTCIVLAAETIDRVRAASGARYQYIVQTERRGTGHAVLQARPVLQDTPGYVLVLYGDTPLINAGTVGPLLERIVRERALLGLISFHANPATGYGRVLRDADNRVLGLIEERNATPEQRALTEANSGIMVFQAAWLWERIATLAPNPINQEYYLTDLVALAVADGGRGAAIAVLATDPRDAWGVNDQAQLAQAAAVLRERIATELLRAGVTIPDPAAVYIDVDSRVGAGTTLHPGTHLRGTTRIGADCTIGPAVTLSDTTVGDRAVVRYAVVEAAVIPAAATVGPFVHLNGGAVASDT
jgi:bifunctional UDP-N-acetylglucosamine pyrophosphorylase / glucosamine-1-phosphate N-acetyltransferase